MSIEDILQKVANGEEITTDERSELGGYKPLDEQGLVDKIVAKERKRADKRVGELEEKLQAYEAQLAELADASKEGEKGKTEAEKLQKQLEKFQKQIEEKDGLIKQKEQDLYAHKKGSVLNSIKSKISLVQGYDTDYVNYTLGKMTAEYEDLEDLTEEADTIAKQFTEAHPQLIKAEGSGTGIQSKRKPTGGSLSADQIKAMSPKDIVANMDKIMAELKKG